MSCNTTPFAALASHKALTAKAHPTWPRHRTPRPTWSRSRLTARAILASPVTLLLATTRSCPSRTSPARPLYLSTHTHLPPGDPMAEKKAQLWAPWRSWRAGSGHDWAPGRRARLPSTCTLIPFCTPCNRRAFRPDMHEPRTLRWHHPDTIIYTDFLPVARPELVKPH